MQLALLSQLAFDLSKGLDINSSGQSTLKRVGTLAANAVFSLSAQLALHSSLASLKLWAAIIDETRSDYLV